MSDHTSVELLWLDKRIENRIRFGRAASEEIIDGHRRVMSFAPGSIFAFVRWSTNDFGTVLSRVDILRAAAPEYWHHVCTTASLSTRTHHLWPAGQPQQAFTVERVLQLIEAR
ncbi:hypothetical protein ACVWYQ_003484 [Bradyrhizobium sp. USDA 3397]